MGAKVESSFELSDDTPVQSVKLRCCAAFQKERLVSRSLRDLLFFACALGGGAPFSARNTVQSQALEQCGLKLCFRTQD